MGLVGYQPCIELVLMLPDQRRASREREVWYQWTKESIHVKGRQENRYSNEKQGKRRCERGTSYGIISLLCRHPLRRHYTACANRKRLLQLFRQALTSTISPSTDLTLARRDE